MQIGTPDTPLITVTILSTITVGPNNFGHGPISVSPSPTPNSSLDNLFSTSSLSLPTLATPTRSGSNSTTSATPGDFLGGAAGTVATSESSGGLSTGAKVGIAIGAAGLVLILLLAALLLRRRSRNRQRSLAADGMPFTNGNVSTNCDITAEKEMHVINSPVENYTPTDTWPLGFAAATAPVASGAQQPRGHSWNAPEEHDTVSYTDDHVTPYSQNPRHSAHSAEALYEEAATATQPQTHILPPVLQATPTVQRKPVGTPPAAATSVGTVAPTHHLHEPGMSDEEMARLEEEERRLDEAIAEAERRRGL